MFRIPKLTTTQYQIAVIVSLVIILLAIFYPRQTPLFKAGVSANVGNIGGKVQFEALEGFDGTSGPTLALFFAPWCGYCKRMMPEWDKATTMNRTNVRLVKINCDEQPELAKKFRVSSYPTIKFLPLGLNNPVNQIDYQGPRKGEAFLAFVANRG